MKEKWKDVIGFEGFYQVSSHGRIRSLSFRNFHGTHPYKIPKILKGQVGKNGYVYVHLKKFGKIKGATIHRLVLSAFRGLPKKKLDAAHMNGVKTDNRLENLKWLTRAENLSHRTLHGTDQLGERNNQAKLTEKQVLKIRLLRLRGTKLAVLAKTFGVNLGTISAIHHQHIWAHIPPMLPAELEARLSQYGEKGF